MSRPAPSLVDRVIHRLAEGEAHTSVLARNVLGLEGHPGAAAAAVFALLGSDPRFAVDAQGTWRLAVAPPGPDALALDRVRFAVVDVETTGGQAGGVDRITEIAIVEVEGGRVTGRYSTLVNPGRRIPSMVSGLTGITDAMVQGAPYFDHVAPEVARRLEGRVFTAHNAAFDRRFVHHELVAALGDAPTGESLCTIALVKALVPALRRRNLDNVAAHFGVGNEARHRALGDALATATVLLRLLDEAASRGIHDLQSLRRVVRGGARRRERPLPRRGDPDRGDPNRDPS